MASYSFWLRGLFLGSEDGELDVIVSEDGELIVLAPRIVFRLRGWRVD
jgi:hypothetical protein